MFGFEPEDDAPPPPPKPVSALLREVVQRLDQAILQTDNAELSALLRQLVGDAGFAWSVSGNLERESSEAAEVSPELATV